MIRGIGAYICTWNMIPSLGNHVLDLAVHLVQLMPWMARGGHSETFSLLEHLPYSTPSWLKVRGWVGWCTM